MRTGLKGVWPCAVEQSHTPKDSPVNNHFGMRLKVSYCYFLCFTFVNVSQHLI